VVGTTNVPAVEIGVVVKGVACETSPFDIAHTSSNKRKFHNVTYKSASFLLQNIFSDLLLRCEGKSKLHKQ